MKMYSSNRSLRSGQVLNACYWYAVVQYNLLQWGR
jgi:hypothetical protein